MTRPRRRQGGHRPRLMQPYASCDRVGRSRQGGGAVRRGLIAQQHVEDIPALATAVASSWLLHQQLVAAFGAHRQLPRCHTRKPATYPAGHRVTPGAAPPPSMRYGHSNPGAGPAGQGGDRARRGRIVTRPGRCILRGHTARLPKASLNLKLGGPSPSTHLNKAGLRRCVAKPHACLALPRCACGHRHRPAGDECSTPMEHLRHGQPVSTQSTRGL